MPIVHRVIESHITLVFSLFLLFYTNHLTPTFPPKKTETQPNFSSQKATTTQEMISCSTTVFNGLNVGILSVKFEGEWLCPFSDIAVPAIT